MPLPATTGVAPAPIDLSGGLVPATGAASIDLSGGLVPKPEEPLISKIGDVGANFATGMVKGAGQTVEGVSSLLNKIPGVGEYLAPSEGVKALDQATQTQGVAQKLGAGAEGLLEFVAGDEALKGLSLAEKLDQAAKIAKFAETSPRVAKALQLGMDVMRGATVGGVEGGLKGGPTGAAEGAALGAGGEAISAGARALAGTGGEPGLVQKLVQGEKIAQGPAKEALTNPWAAARTASKSFRTFLDPEILKAQTEADVNFNAVDKTAGVDLKGLTDKLIRVKRAIRVAVDPDVEARLELNKTNIEKTIKEAVDTLGPNGMQKYQTANAAFSHSKALEDLRDDVFMNQSAIHGNAAQGEDETIELNHTIKALQALDDDKYWGRSRLAQAIGGPDGEAKAQQVLTELRAARKAGQSAINARRLFKILGIGSGFLAYAAHRAAFDTMLEHMGR